MNDRWDLSYLYQSFEDEAFRRDLESLPAEIERLQGLLSDESLPPRERLEQFLDVLKSAGLRFPFKAVLTETNRQWLPGVLFAHMLAERAEIQRQLRSDM